LFWSTSKVAFSLQWWSVPFTHFFSLCMFAAVLQLMCKNVFSLDGMLRWHWEVGHKLSYGHYGTVLWHWFAPGTYSLHP
jgi:hypothetical protein